MVAKNIYSLAYIADFFHFQGVEGVSKFKGIWMWKAWLQTTISDKQEPAWYQKQPGQAHHWYDILTLSREKLH